MTTRRVKLTVSVEAKEGCTEFSLTDAAAAVYVHLPEDLRDYVIIGRHACYKNSVSYDYGSRSVCCVCGLLAPGCSTDAEF